MSQFGRILEAFGKQLAWFWLGIVALVLLFSFLICGIAASIFVGACAAWLVGYGTFGVIVFFVVAFFFNLFLSVFVWEPHVKRVTHGMIDYLSEHRP
jgi:uncharacterized membrane protein